MRDIVVGILLGAILGGLIGLGIGFDRWIHKQYHKSMAPNTHTHNQVLPDHDHSWDLTVTNLTVDSFLFGVTNRSSE